MNNDNTVLIHDPNADSPIRIPAAELAPRMIQARFEAIDELVWINPSDLAQLEKEAPFRHPPFPEPARAFIRQIQCSFPGVYDKSLTFWEDGFRRDTHPEREITIWLHVAQIYRHFSEERPLDFRAELFRLLMACSNVARSQIRHVVAPEIMTGDEVNVVISAYYDGIETVW